MLSKRQIVRVANVFEELFASISLLLAYASLGGVGWLLWRVEGRMWQVIIVGTVEGFAVTTATSPKPQFSQMALSYWCCMTPLVPAHPCPVDTITNTVCMNVPASMIAHHVQSACA